MIILKASENQKNLYFIYRVSFPYKLTKIGFASIVPDSSYCISSIENINTKELLKIQKRCRKLANLEGKSSRTEFF